MARRRVNPARVSHKAAKRYESSHWGIPPEKVYEIDDPDLPPHVIEMGKLHSLEVVTQDGDAFTIEFPEGCHLVFSPSKDERLYCVLTPGMERWCRDHLVVKGEPWYWLHEIAANAPGRQNGWTWHRVQCQALGWLDKCLYVTEKKGDGLSTYVHALGEESGKQPLLCVDKRGKLWIAGGNYKIPSAGICD